MLNKISYRNRILIGIATAVILLRVIYVFAISGTIDAYREYNRANAEVQKLNNAPQEIQKIRADIARMEEAMNMRAERNVLSQEKLLGVVGDFSQRNRMIIREFPERIRIQRDDFSVETAVIRLEGRYTDMLRMIYLLEEEKKYGTVASADFISVTDPRTKKRTLNAKIYFQLIKKQI